MKKFNNPEMKIASFDKEAILTASSFLETVQDWLDGADGTTRQSVTVDYEEMQNVSFGF